MKKKALSNNIDFIPYSNINNGEPFSSKNQNSITELQQTNSNNYLSSYKEYETNPNNNINNNSNNHNIKNSLNEKIYANNSKKLSEYYSKNKEDIILYGSSKYDLLTVDNLVQEMKQYKNSIIKKIKQNPNKYKLKNFSLKNSNSNMILTPLAEIERSKMGNNEKELFNLAERRGVVMRRIEYSNALYGDRDCELQIFLMMKNAVKMIEKCWLFYKGLKKRKMIKGIILLDKYIKRKVIKIMNEINNERLKNIYMNFNSNVSSISFKNINIKGSENSSTNNKRYNSIDKKYFDRLERCFIEKINIFGNNSKDGKKQIEEIQKKYYKLILDYKMMQEELKKYKNENSEMKNKINILLSENKEINNLKIEKDELIKKFDELNSNYDNLLKDFDALNANNSNLLSNQSIIFNSFKNNNIQIKETEEYISLQNEYNVLNDKNKQLSKEIDKIKKQNKELNELIIKKNQENNNYIPIDEETINEINEYKNKIEELNKQLLKQENNYEQQIKNLNDNIDSLIKEKEDLNKKIVEFQIQKKSEELTKNNDYINQKQIFENKINDYEKQIERYTNIIKDKDISLNNKEKYIVDYKNKINNYEKENLEYKNKLIQLTNKITNYEQIININKIQENQNIENNKENINLKLEIEKQKTIVIKYKKDIDIINIRLNESQKKINLYLQRNNQLKEENNKNKKNISKLNNLIIGLNTRIETLLEENKNIRDKIKNKYIYNNKNIQKLCLLFITGIMKKKISKYKYRLMINLFRENINNFTQYIIYQNNSLRSSVNLDGYEKVITGESKKIITRDKDQNNVSYNNKIVIHNDLDDTLKDYIIKGKDNLTFDEIFEVEKIKNDNNNNNKDNFVNKKIYEDNKN